MRVRFERLVGSAAFLGAAGAYVTLLIHWLATRWHPSWVGPPDRVLAAVMGSGLGLLFEPLDLLILRRGYLWLPLLAVPLAWRPTRRLVVAALGLLVMLLCVRLVALACFSVYVMDHRLGLLAVPLAILPAAWLTRWRRWPIASIIVVAVGLCVGTLIGTVFQHDTPQIVSPLRRFVPTALLSLVVAWVISARIADSPSASRGRFVRMWGLMALCVSCVMVVGVVTAWLRPRAAPANRLPADSTYDVFITQDPANLVWTDTEDIHVLTDPYGESHERYVLGSGRHRTPQRIWASPTDGFYVQMLLHVGWWKTPPDGQPITQAPEVEYRHAAWQDGSPGALVEDPASRAVFIVNQWGSHYAVMDRDSGATRQAGFLSRAFLAAWHSTAALPSRIVYTSSALGDGSLFEVDLDSLAITRRASAVNVYEKVLDPERQLIWGARPSTGDVVGIDTRTFEIVQRFRTGFGSRDLQRDPTTGVLYTCALSGDVFRVDPRSGSTARIAWCGRLCRNLFLDARRETLWAATDDGICRIHLGSAHAPSVADGGGP